MNNKSEWAPTSQAQEQQEFINDGWKQTDYSSFFTEGDEAEPEDFPNSEYTKDILESKEITMAAHKTSSDTFADVIYIKEGDFTPPNNCWSYLEVYRVEGGHWKQVKRESAQKTPL